MKINQRQLDVALARSCLAFSELRNQAAISSATLAKLRRDPGYRPKPKVVGKLAKALGVNVEDIIEEEVNTREQAQ